MANSVNPVLHALFDHRSMVLMNCPNSEGKYDILFIKLMKASVPALSLSLIIIIRKNNPMVT